MTADEPLVVRPDRASAARWTAGALLLPAATAWTVADSGGALWAWIVLALTVAVTLYFAAQLAVPALFEIELDSRGLRIRQPWLRAEIAWQAVTAARIERSFGDPVLVVEVRVDAEDGQAGHPPRNGAARGHTVRTLLPLGADPAAIEQVLAERLADARGTVAPGPDHDRAGPPT